MVLDTHTGTTRVDEFISGRINALAGDGGKVALWMIPKHDFLRHAQHDIHDPLLQRIELLGGGSRTPRFTSQGLLIERRNYLMEGVDSYVLFSRNGVIEAVNACYLHPFQKQKRLPVDRSLNYERDIVEAVVSYLELYRQLKIRCPVLLKLAITNCRGAYLVGSSFHYWNNENRQLQENEIISDLLTITDFHQDLPALLKPFFDRVWHGCEFPHSFNYTREGKWQPR